MRLLVFAVVLVLACGCTAPPALDAEVVTALTIGIRTTCVAMDVPLPPPRALHDQAGLLAIQSPPKRQAAIRAGRIPSADIAGASRDLLLDLDRRRPELTPPLMLSWLTEHVIELDANQLLLLDALVHQTEREAHLKDDRR